jgi:stage V sporulation protein R
MSLEQAIEQINVIASDFGLDPFPMRYEICPASIIHTFASYGMPARYTHWSFGKAYHRLKLNEQLGLGKIYELVINHNPCYAFLLDSNSLLQNKLIIAHVIAHSDFFKNNVYFAKTNRQMIESMSSSAKRIRSYEEQVGIRAVEQILDAVHALNVHSNVLKVMVEQGTHLSDWTKDLMMIGIEEMDYFWPQMETKICNEGWATYWHRAIVRELPLTADETIEYARMHAAVIQPSRYSPNPYQLGLALFESIASKSGRIGLFLARTLESDLSMLRNELTPMIIEDLHLHSYIKRGGEFTVADSDWTNIRDQLVVGKINCGFPLITAEVALDRSLQLTHAYEGEELDLKELERTLPYVHHLWRYPVKFYTKVDGRPAAFTYDGSKIHKQFG